MSDELKAMLRQAPMNGFAIRTLAYIEKLEAQLAARCSAVSAPSDLRAALQDIAESEPIPTFAEAWKWCKEIAQAALTCPEPQASADSEPIAWATPIADGTHQLTRHEEVAGRWRDCNLKVIELYARPQPERAEPQTAGAESHSPAAMEGEKDTIVNLIHEHVGFEVLLAIESGVLTGVEDAAEAILAELGRRSQAGSDEGKS